MQIKQKKDTRKTTIIVVVVIVVVLLGLGVYWLLTRDSGNSPAPSDQTTNTPSTPSVKTDETDTSPTVDKTTEEVPTNKTGTIAITSFSQANGVVSARATTTNFDTKECIYTFTTSGGKPVIEEQNGACKSISLSQDLFDKIATYTLTVTAYSSDEKITTSKEVDIR